MRGLIVGKYLVDAEGDICELMQDDISKGLEKWREDLTSKELSTGLPRPLPMPHEHKKTAQVMDAPMRMASTVPISGKFVTRHRK